MILRLILWPVRLLGWLLLMPLRAFRRRRAAGEGWVLLDLEGAVEEFETTTPWYREWIKTLLGRPDEPTTDLQSIRRLTKTLASDPRAKGLFVRMSGPLQLDFATAETLHHLFFDLRANGKQVFFHGLRHVGAPELLIASSGNQFLMSPVTSLSVQAAESTGLFFRETLEKLGLRFEVASVGRFKSAPDRLTKTGRSEPDKEQTLALIRDRDQRMLAALDRGRNLDRNAAVALLQQSPMSSQQALEQGFLDGLLRDEDVEAHVSIEAFVATEAYLKKTRRRSVTLRKPKKLAVVEVHGAIVDEDAPSLGNRSTAAVGKRVVNKLRKVLEDKRVGAVILHINSRGGSVEASDAIYAATRRLAKEKPVVACFGDVAASGGYYVACGAHAIVASPATITGSIGVFALFPTWPELAERAGIHQDVLVDLADAPRFSPWRGFAEDGLEKAERQVRETYAVFTALVAQARNKSIESVIEVAEGRVWTGEAAHSHGLVDGLGGLPEAVERVRTLAETRLAEIPTVTRPKGSIQRPPSLEAQLMEWQQLVRSCRPGVMAYAAIEAFR
jgi:protease IV